MGFDVDWGRDGLKDVIRGILRTKAWERMSLNEMQRSSWLLTGLGENEGVVNNVGLDKIVGVVNNVGLDKIVARPSASGPRQNFLDERSPAPAPSEEIAPPVPSPER